MAVAFGDDHRLGSIDELIGRLVVAGLAGLAVAVVLAMIMSRQLMRPLEALTGVVRQFGPDRYDMRASDTGPSQVRDLARAFNAMAERISDNERAMRSFIADVSHELRTPLTSIRGFVEALRDGTVTDPERRASSLEVVHEETQRMLRMIEQLLDLSRLEAGEYRLEPSRIDLDELLGYIEAMFGGRADESGVILRAEIEAGTPTIEADYDRLVQVLNNLMDNALRHTSEGSVTVAGRTVDDGIEIRVEDSGEGIAAEDLGKLFDRFWQPESRSGPGAGLGLAISREIVRAHGGRIGLRARSVLVRRSRCGCRCVRRSLRKVVSQVSIPSPRFTRGPVPSPVSYPPPDSPYRPSGSPREAGTEIHPDGLTSETSSRKSVSPSLLPCTAPPMRGRVPRSSRRNARRLR